MGKLKAIILTEGGSSIGFGHVTRCLSMYQALEEREVDVQLMIFGDTNVDSILTGTKYSVEDWINNDSFIPKLSGVNLLVIDSMLGGKERIETLISYVDASAIIDDSMRLCIDLPLVYHIDWTPFVENLYDGKFAQNGCQLLGSNYISLRKSFWDVRPKETNDTVNNFLVILGGSDIRNLSPAVVKSLVSFNDNCSINMVVGKGFSEETISELISLDISQLNLIYSPAEKEIVDLFLAADIAISGGGQTLYELARVGVPTVAIQIIENQSRDIAGWLNCNFIKYAGSWDTPDLHHRLQKCINELDDPITRRKRMQIGRKHVDGNGARRIIDKILSSI